jgi:hypothetical protein
MKKLTDWLLTAIVIPVAVVLIILFFFGAPIATAWETRDIIRMRETTPATVLTAESLRGRPVITYSYTINGQNFKSDRYLPGFWGNRGRWTGGGSAVKHFQPGQMVIIHYDPDDPARCCLEWGWFKWSVGFMLGVWGGFLKNISTSSKGRFSLPQDSRWALIGRIAGVAGILYGVGLAIFGPDAVRIHELHLHAAFFLGAIAVSIILDAVKRRRKNRDASTT